jgi:hypothetical protein
MDNFFDAIISTGTRILKFIRFGLDAMMENPALIVALIAIYIAKDAKLKVGNILDVKV